MKIISDFHDYYDIGLGISHHDSQEFVFNRKTSEKYIDLGTSKNITIDKREFEEKFSFLFMEEGRFWGKYLSIQRTINYETFVLIFCGKIYPGVKLFRGHSDVSIGYSNSPELDQLKTSISFKNKFFNYQLNSFINSIDVWNNLDVKDRFIESKDVITLVEATYKGVKITINPNLKNLSFQKVFSPYSAYQEIEMFLGGMISKKENDILKISDVYMLVTKGFDKWSFKKLPDKMKEI